MLTVVTVGGRAPLLRLFLLLLVVVVEVEVVVEAVLFLSCAKSSVDPFWDDRELLDLFLVLFSIVLLLPVFLVFFVAMVVATSLRMARGVLGLLVEPLLTSLLVFSGAVGTCAASGDSVASMGTDTEVGFSRRFLNVQTLVPAGEGLFLSEQVVTKCATSTDRSAET